MSGYCIVTLGCKVNQYESEALAARLEAGGWRVDDARPSLCLVNTCAVTGKAAMQSRQAIRRLKRQFPGARLVVTGCYAQTAPEEITAIEGLDLVVGHAAKGQIADLIETPTLDPPQVRCGSLPADLPFDAVSDDLATQRSRPFLKVQDGCDAFCAYCIVPHARGPSRSMPAASVLNRVEGLRNRGYNEIVLTGIHLGCYGRDLTPATTLAQLIRRTDRIPGVPRLRLSSVEPQEFDAHLVEAIAIAASICPHFHIPLQSGDDRLLARMGRPYTGAAFARLVQRLVAALPLAAVGTDVLVGFPGETEDAFQASYRLIERLPIAYLHVFPFSPRQGTPASRYPDPIAPATVKRRCELLRRLGAAKQSAFRQRFVGQVLPAVIEGRPDGPSGRRKVLTGNYIPVWIDAGDDVRHGQLAVRIESVDRHGRSLGRAMTAPSKPDSM